MAKKFAMFSHLDTAHGCGRRKDGRNMEDGDTELRQRICAFPVYDGERRAVSLLLVAVTVGEVVKRKPCTRPAGPLLAMKPEAVVRTCTCRAAAGWHFGGQHVFVERRR